MSGGRPPLVAAERMDLKLACNFIRAMARHQDGGR
jgi:hypothetical protein